MSAHRVISEVFLALVLTHGIAFFASILWDTNALLLIVLPIFFAFCFGLQIAHIFYNFTGE